MSYPKIPIEIRLMRWSFETKGGCIEWVGAKDKDGYGVMTISGDGGKKVKKAHRVSYELFENKIEDGLQIDHLCRNRSCINPHHLEPVNPGTNIRRGLTGKQNNWNANKTHCPKGHPYNEDNTYWHEVGGRQCRTCKGLKPKSEARKRERH